MQQRRINVIVDKKGNFTMEALEGFVGTQCSEKLKDLELVLGGTLCEEKKKPEYYGSDAYDPMTLKL